MTIVTYDMQNVAKPLILICASCNDQDGFIHLTSEPGMLLTVANNFYVDVPGDWEVLVIEPSKLTSQVIRAIHMYMCQLALLRLRRHSAATRRCLITQRQTLVPTSHERVVLQVKHEPAAPVGDKPAGSLDERKWPHLYGTIDVESVLRRLPVRRDSSGRFLEIAEQ